MLISPCVLRVSWSYSSLFSISASCKRHGIDPSRYLVDVLRRPPTTSTDQLTEFLPDVWFQAHPDAARERAVSLDTAIRWVDNHAVRQNGCVGFHWVGSPIEAQLIVKRR
jgi:hypothetical protein